MFEKVNPSHPDKLADRIAGALVDMAYAESTDGRPRIAVEVLIGHGTCHIITETSVKLPLKEVEKAVKRITGSESIVVDYKEVPQDEHLAENQSERIRCGDNGIFRGVPLTKEQRDLNLIAQALYREFPSDGKYILDSRGDRLVICQSNADGVAIDKLLRNTVQIADTITCTINPLGDWVGGTDADCGATNRKLGSDMYDSVTGGGIHGKDLSKADVSVNIYAWMLAQMTGNPVEFSCAIGDETVAGIPYGRIVNAARRYVESIGGFEKLAEWGLQ